MSNSNVPAFTQTLRSASTAITSGIFWNVSATSTTNLTQIIAATGNGCRVTSLIFSTTDSAANNIYLVLNGGGGGGTLSIVGQVNVPLTSGTTASVLSVDALSPTVTVGLPIDNNGKRFIHMETNDILYVGLVASMTSGKIFTSTATYEQY
jgi:hypothetical protein